MDDSAKVSKPLLTSSRLLIISSGSASLGFVSCWFSCSFLCCFWLETSGVFIKSEREDMLSAPVCQEELFAILNIYCSLCKTKWIQLTKSVLCVYFQTCLFCMSHHACVVVCGPYLYSTPHGRMVFMGNNIICQCGELFVLNSNVNFNKTRNLSPEVYKIIRQRNLSWRRVPRMT